MPKLLDTWLARYSTKADALRDLNKSLEQIGEKPVPSNRLYDWLNPDANRDPPEAARIIMRKKVIQYVLENEGVAGLDRRTLNRIVDKLS